MSPVSDLKPPNHRLLASRLSPGLAAVLVALAAWLCYFNTFSVPLLFDDLVAIRDNPTIRQLSALRDVLSPPNDGSGVTGRPLVNLSLAINHTLGGQDPRGYHVTNLLLHVAAGLALFGLVRRTLLLPSLQARFGASSTALALVVALLWTVHPLQTESVTCIIQRTEVLVGLWYVLTLYCFARGLGEGAAGFWHPLAVGTCLLGMASKEVMVSAPLLALLYDRTFTAGTFQAALRLRWKTYCGLGATWLLLTYLVAGGGGSRGTAAGFGLGVTWWSYALKQCEAIILYLRLSFWPHPLVLDYGTAVVSRPAEVWPQAVLLLGLVVAAFYSLRRFPIIGFVALWFFALLAPSSSVVPLVTQTMAEHRMYLPLAAVVTLAVFAGYSLGGPRALLVSLVVLPLLGWRTIQRNGDYATAVGIWTDTLAKAKDNNRARNNLASALRDAGRLTEALALCRTALAIEPDNPEALCSLGGLLNLTGQYAEAIAPSAKAARLRPRLVEAHVNLATALGSLGRHREAVASLRTAVALNPRLDYVRGNLAHGLILLEQFEEAIVHCRAALAENPAFGPAHAGWGQALLNMNRVTEAVPHCEAAVRLMPDNLEARVHLAAAYLNSGRPAEAAEHYRVALRAVPDHAEIRSLLALALARAGRPGEAVAEYEAVLRRQPDDFSASLGLAQVLAQIGRTADALPHAESALRLQPDSPDARRTVESLRGQGPGRAGPP